MDGQRVPGSHKTRRNYLVIGILGAIALAVIFLSLTSLPLFLMIHEWIWPWESKPKKVLTAAWATAESNARQGVLLTLGGSLAIVGLIFTWLRHRREEALSKIESDRHWTHRYTEAVTQLGSETLAIQLGGVYALERLAHDAPSPADRQTIAEVFAAYLREYSVSTESDDSGPAMMTSVCRTVAEALGRVATAKLLRPLDLSHIVLSEASFANADLSGWTLFGATMWRSRLDHANLKNAFMPAVRLNEASLVGAILDEAIMHDAELLGSNMEDASLRGTELSRTTIAHAFVKGADFEGANISASHLGGIVDYTPSQLDEAGSWDSTTVWPDGFVPTTLEKGPGNQAPFHY